MGCIALLTGGFGSAELTEAGASRVAESPADLIGIDWQSSLSEL